jgi:hypothetical protein
VGAVGNAITGAIKLLCTVGGTAFYAPIGLAVRDWDAFRAAGSLARAAYKDLARDIPDCLIGMVSPSAGNVCAFVTSIDYAGEQANGNFGVGYDGRVIDAAVHWQATAFD